MTENESFPEMWSESERGSGIVCEKHGRFPHRSWCPPCEIEFEMRKGQQ